MESVTLAPRSLDDYIECAGAAAIAALKDLAAPLRGLRVVHVNATPVGGGVAEILRSKIPLLRDLGLAASWRTLTAEPAFFETTKAMHNALQGADCVLTAADQDRYLAWQRRNAESLAADYDLVVVHDPQPLGLRKAAGARGARWVWRLHIDSSCPNPNVWAFLRPLLAGYERTVFTLPEFVPPGVDAGRARIISPAIDPLSPKNCAVPDARARAIMRRLDLDPGRPLVAQIARLDPWKDPIGVIDAYRLARRSIPGLQLALLGVIEAQDDPEAVSMAAATREHAGDDPGIHIFTDPERVGPVEVAAVQQMAQVVLQKSRREGFGLSVAEALWKATPVVGGRAGGIRLQLDDGVGGFLVASVEEAAARMRWLLAHPPEARSIAARGRDRVRSRFLITRLLADELALYADVLDLQAPQQAAAD